MKFTSGHTIVVSAKASSAVNWAAEQLREYLEKILGAAYPIRTDRVRRDSRIIVGDIKDGLIPREKIAGLRNDGYMYTVGKDEIQIASNTPRGVVYGIFSFLEDEAGCRFFAKNDFYIPRLRQLDVHEKTRSYSPPTYFRDYCDGACHSPEYGAANKLNGIYYKLEEKHGGRFEIGPWWGHTLPFIFKPEKYFAEHPDWYAFTGGERRAYRKDFPGHHTQVCFSNPEIVPITLEWLYERKRMRPDVNAFSVSMADGYNYCECEKCKAAEKKYGSKSAPLMLFLNEVAREAKKEYPDILINTLAYLHLRKPPRGLKIEKNIMVLFCSIECCATHALGECSFMDKGHYETDKSPAPAQYVDDLKGWHALTKNLLVWDYPCSCFHALIPVPNFKVIQHNIRLQVENGVKGIFLNAGFFTESASYAALRGYLYAKCMWDPDCGMERHFMEFTDFYYGPAASKMREAIRYLEARDKRMPMHLNCVTMRIDLNYFNDQFRKEYGAILAQAEKAAGGDEKILKRIRQEQLCIPLTELIGIRSDTPGYDDKLKAFLARAKEIGVENLAEGAAGSSSDEKKLAVYKKNLTAYEWLFDIQ
jgi:hypothetical protein